MKHALQIKIDLNILYRPPHFSLTSSKKTTTRGLKWYMSPFMNAQVYPVTQFHVALQRKTLVSICTSVKISSRCQYTAMNVLIKLNNSESFQNSSEVGGIE